MSLLPILLALAALASACTARADLDHARAPGGAAVTEVIAQAAQGPVVATSFREARETGRARQAGLPLRRHPVADDGSEIFGVILPRGSDWTPVMEAFVQAEDGYARSTHFRDLLRRHLGEELASLLSGG